jgi:protocatechuate 3,4-dioxygenase beta subunit
MFAKPKPALMALFLAALLFEASTFAFHPPLFANDKPKDLSSTLILVDEKEPGDRLIVSGIVYDRSGKKSMPGITLYVYHTDKDGLYNRDENSVPQIQGWLKTDKDGRYEIRTIKPGPYPRQRIAAHIHIQASSDGIPEHYVEELHFEDDPYLSERKRQRDAKNDEKFSTIAKLEKGKDGVLTAVYNIRLKR